MGKPKVLPTPTNLRRPESREAARRAADKILFDDVMRARRMRKNDERGRFKKPTSTPPREPWRVGLEKSRKSSARTCQIRNRET